MSFESGCEQFVCINWFAVSIKYNPLPGEHLCILLSTEVVMTSVPQNPDLAKHINLEGSVTINVLMDKEGKVKKALVLKTSDDLYTQPSFKAAKK